MDWFNPLCQFSKQQKCLVHDIYSVLWYQSPIELLCFAELIMDHTPPPAQALGGGAYQGWADWLGASIFKVPGVQKNKLTMIHGSFAGPHMFVYADHSRLYVVCLLLCSAVPAALQHCSTPHILVRGNFQNKSWELWTQVLSQLFDRIWLLILAKNRHKNYNRSKARCLKRSNYFNV